MKKSEFLKERREYILSQLQWETTLRKDAEAAAEGALRVAVNHAEAAGVEWDPEEPPLPGRLDFVPATLSCAGAAKDPATGRRIVLAQLQEGEAALEAMVAAYNREREEEAFDAEHGAEFSAAVEEVCKGEVDALVAQKVKEERDRCLGILDELVNQLESPIPYSAAKRARSKVASGAAPHRPGTGADDLPNPEPPEPTYPCAKCGRLRTKAQGGTTFTVCDGCWEKTHSEAEPEWPTLAICFGHAGGCAVVARSPARSSPGFVDLRSNEAKEVLRRWEAEPKLRSFLNELVVPMSNLLNMLDKNVAPGQRSRVGDLCARLQRILTGKES